VAYDDGSQADSIEGAWDARQLRPAAKLGHPLVVVLTNPDRLPVILGDREVIWANIGSDRIRRTDTCVEIWKRETLRSRARTLDDRGIKTSCGVGYVAHNWEQYEGSNCPK
jgi:hypothetical protein